MPRLIRNSINILVLFIDVCRGFVCLHRQCTTSLYLAFLNLAAMYSLAHCPIFSVLYFCFPFISSFLCIFPLLPAVHQRCPQGLGVCSRLCSRHQHSIERWAWWLPEDVAPRHLCQPRRGQSSLLSYQRYCNQLHCHIHRLQVSTISGVSYQHFLLPILLLSLPPSFE